MSRPTLGSRQRNEHLYEKTHQPVALSSMPFIIQLTRNERSAVDIAFFDVPGRRDVHLFSPPPPKVGVR
jgi:hypothetical protein